MLSMYPLHWVKLSTADFELVFSNLAKKTSANNRLGEETTVAESLGFQQRITLCTHSHIPSNYARIRVWEQRFTRSFAHTKAHLRTNITMWLHFLPGRRSYLYGICLPWSIWSCDNQLFSDRIVRWSHHQPDWFVPSCGDSRSCEWKSLHHCHPIRLSAWPTNCVPVYIACSHCIRLNWNKITIPFFSTNEVLQTRCLLTECGMHPVWPLTVSFTFPVVD